MAGGRVRCNQCHQVFNALESFAETKDETTDWPESRFIRKIDFEHDSTLLESEPTPQPFESMPPASEQAVHDTPPEQTSPLVEDDSAQDKPEPNDAQIDTRFNDYLAELERQTDILLAQSSNIPGSGDASDNTAKEQNTENNTALPDSLAIDDSTQLDLPAIDDTSSNIPTQTELNEAFLDEQDDPPPNISADDLGIDDSNPDLEEMKHEWPFRDSAPESSPDTHSTTANSTPAVFKIDTNYSDSDFAEKPANGKIDPAPDEDENADDSLPYRLASDVPEIPPSPETDLSEEPLSVDDEPDEKTGRKKGSGLLWAFLILILLIAAAIQFTWIYREQLITHPVGAKYLDKLCGIIDCELPERRAPEKFEVINRSLIIAPDRPDILQLKLNFTNTANFPQPYPGLQLNLYSGDEKLIARRTFKPSEYMGKSVSEHSLIKPRENINVDLSLEEPDKEVSGFRFDFK